MELRRYWHILSRRWWLIALLVAVVLIVSLVTRSTPPPVYQVGLRFSVGIEGVEPVAAVSGEGRSDAWLASEYLADDLSEVLKGSTFAQQIGQQVGFNVPVGTIFATREHRIMSVSISTADRDQVQEIADAVIAAVEDGGAAYFPQLSQVQASAILVNRSEVVQVGASLRATLDLPIRLLLALVAGVAIALLWDYLDDTVRDRAEAEALGPDVLGEIPRKPHVWRRVKGP